MIMKQAKFIIPFAAAILLAGCVAGGDTTSSSSKDSSEPSTIVPAESSDSSSSSKKEESASSDKGESISSEKSETVTPDSSDKSEEPTPAAISIDNLKQYSSAFSSNVSKIKDGEIKRTDIFGSESTTNFEYGKDKNGDTLKATILYDTYYVMKDGDGNVITITTDIDDNFVKADDYSTYTSVGPRFKTALSETPVCGAENFLADLVGKASKNPNKDFAASTNGENISFSFGYFDNQDTVYEISAEFNVGETLTYFDFTIKQYSTRGKYSFDSATSTFTITDGATSDGTDHWNVTQTVGKRTYTNDVDLSSFEFKTISVSDGEGNDLDTFTPTELGIGGEITVYLTTSPDTASTDFDSLSWEITSGDKDGLTGSKITYDEWAEQYVLTLTAVKEGDYVVKVKNSTGEASADFAISVAAVEVKGMSVRVYSEDPNNEYLSRKLVDGQTVEATTTEGYNYLYFVPNVKTSGTSGAYEATLTDSEGEEVVIDEDDEDIYFEAEDSFNLEDESIDAIGFYSNDEGEYTLTITAKDDPTISQSFTINVVETDPIDVLGKSYVIENSDGGKDTLTFKDYESDHYSGTMVLTGEDGSETEAAYTIVNDDESYSTFVYSEDDEGLIPYYLTYGADGKLYYSDEEDGWVEPLYSSDSDEYKLLRTWKGTVTSDDKTYTMTLDFSADGIASGSIEGDDIDTADDFKSEYTVNESTDGSFAINFVDDGLVMCENSWFAKTDVDDYFGTANWDKDADSISLNATTRNLAFTLTPSAD